MLPIPSRRSLGPRRQKAAALALAFAATGAGCCPAFLRAQEHNADALAAATAQIRQGRYNAAIATIQRALPAHPTDPKLPTVEGVAYSLQGDDTHALECFQQALKIAPGFPRALQAEASILSRRRDPAAIPVLQQILHEDPHDATAHEMLGLAQAQTGDCTSALREFAQAGPSLEAHAASLQHKAACLLQAKDFPGAISAFEHVHSLRPDDTANQYDLAVAQSESGDAKAAATTLAPLLERAPDLDTLLLAADVFEQVGDTPRAAGLLRQAIVADPARSNSYVRFAELCMTHESYQPGIDMVTAGIARQPHDSSLFLARGLLYGGMAQYDKAEADFHSAELYDPNHGTGAYAVGMIEAQRNDPTQALLTVRKALAAHPNDAQLHFLLGRLLVEKGAEPDSQTYAEATRSVQEAVRLEPNLVAARNLLAKIYLDTGKPALAIEQCRAALALDPTDGNALYRLMRSLRATGDTNAAQAVALQVAAQHQRAREEETGRLRYRIEEGSAPASGKPPASANPPVNSSPATPPRLPR